MPFTEITPTADIAVHRHGNRAKCLQRLLRLGLPVPQTVALSFKTVRESAQGTLPDIAKILGHFATTPLLVSVRSSSEAADWGGPGTILNVGMNTETRDHLAGEIGATLADKIYLRFIRSFAIDVMRLDEMPFLEACTVDQALNAYEAEMDVPFPQNPETHLSEVLRSMARAWEGTSARLLRQAQGAPVDAGLGLVVQRMALGHGAGQSGSGVIQFVSSSSGLPQVTGRYMGQSMGREALSADKALYLTKDKRGQSLEDILPDVFQDLIAAGEVMRRGLKEEMQIEFTVEEGRLAVLDGVRTPRSARADVKIVTALVEDGILTREEAVMRITPATLSQLLHHHLDPDEQVTVLAEGIAASPGVASGKIVFDATAAQATAAQGEACILVRRETAPEDVRGMHAAVAILTERGGTTSHAAVIARGLGLPCITSVNGLTINMRKKTITLADGRRFAAGDILTIDGTEGRVLAGQVAAQAPALDAAFSDLMRWADDIRDIGVRANADTPADAMLARRFGADGIGLCRTEHMFFEPGRLTLMREAIFASEPQDRAAALERLLPMQRADFTELFTLMEGWPVCMRLLDPPLHEFLPTQMEGIRGLAEALNLPISEVKARIESLEEFNPMLGMRGVRLGLVVPEIYEMQARAIFEATVEAQARGIPVVPEIMIPLVSARREVELVGARVDAIASAVRQEHRTAFDYTLGVMVETPRAALRAGEIAEFSSFLSFGTNDLTQMTYGLSRDDAGRFMSTYVNAQIYPEDPFQRLDVEGVGQLLLIGAERGRAVRETMILSLCGEHGGDPEAIAFCRKAGFDYVSCSPYRVPVSKLAAAQATLTATSKYFLR